jgi:hypothetical protein
VIQLKFNEPIKSKSMLIQLVNRSGINIPYTATVSGSSLTLKLHPFHYIDYINPNRTPNYNLNTLKSSGITDIFILVSRSSGASNYYKTYLPKIIPKFKAVGIRLHAWIFPNFTTQDVTRIAAMGVNVHMDLEFGYFPSTEYLTNLVSSMRKASAGRIFTVAVDPNAPFVDSGAVYGEDYSLIAPHVDAIVPMLYKDYFELSNAKMRSAAAYMQKQAPGKLWIALQTYVSDTDPTPLSKSEDLTQINDVKTYSNGLAPFRYGISNFEAVIKAITSKSVSYEVILHSNSLTDLAGNPLSLSAFSTA